MNKSVLFILLILLLPFQASIAQKIISEKYPKAIKKQTILWTTDWSTDDKQIATGGDDSLLRIYYNKNIALVKTFAIKSMIRQVKWHPKKLNIIAVATNDDKSIILNTVTGDTIFLKGITYGARAIGWNYDGELLATADNVGLIKIWNLKGSLLKTIKKEDSNSYFSLDWHPNKNILAVSGDDIRLIDTSGVTLTTIKHRKENTGILAIRWHPSGEFFATGDYGHDNEGIKSIIQFWKADGTLIKTMQGSNAEYRNIQWNKEGSHLASASDALRVWDKNGQLLYTGKSEDLLWGIDWNSKSKQIVTTSIEGHVKLWTERAKLVKETAD